MEIGVLWDYAESKGLEIHKWEEIRDGLDARAVPPKPGVYRGPSIAQPRMTHPTHSWCGARPDGFLIAENGERRLIEVKTCRSFRDWNDKDGNEIIPPHYMIQVQWQMFVTGINVCDVEAFCTIEDSRRSYEVRYNDELIKRVFQIVSSWRDDHLLGSKLPENITYEVAGLVWPAPREPETWLDPDDEDMLDGLTYAKISGQIKELEEKKDIIKSKLCAKIKDTHGINRVASWKWSKRGRMFRCLIDA
jgi:predicted phage-related endonuclease